MMLTQPRDDKDDISRFSIRYPLDLCDGTEDNVMDNVPEILVSHVLHQVILLPAELLRVQETHLGHLLLPGKDVTLHYLMEGRVKQILLPRSHILSVFVNDAAGVAHQALLQILE